MTDPSNISPSNTMQADQSPVPSQNKLLIIALSTFFVSAIFFGTVRYYFGKTSEVTKTQEQAENLEPSPTIDPMSNVPDEGDPTSQWQTYSDPSLNIKLKHPSEILVEKQELNPLNSPEGFPIEWLEIGKLLTISHYYDRLQTPWFKSNLELIQKIQTDLPSVKTRDGNYVLTKVNWEGGAGGQEHCSDGYASLKYFVDIPDRVSITISFSEQKSCGAFGEQVVQKSAGGTNVSAAEFEDLLLKTYQILSTLEFTN